MFALLSYCSKEQYNKLKIKDKTVTVELHKQSNRCEESWQLQALENTKLTNATALLIQHTFNTAQLPGRVAKSLEIARHFMSQHPSTFVDLPKTCMSANFMR